MASYGVAATDHGTYAHPLAASAVDTVTFAKDLVEVEVTSDGTAAIYFTVDGSTPTVGGQATYELPAQTGVKPVRKVRGPATSPDTHQTVVKLISAATPTYSVLGY
jgi:hypothetical protein